MSYVNICSQNNKCLEGISREGTASLTPAEENYIILLPWISLYVISVMNKGNITMATYILRLKLSILKGL